MSEVAAPVPRTDRENKLLAEPKKTPDAQKNLSSEKQLPLEQKIMGELQQASLDRQAREALMGGEKEVQKPKIINLGNVPAFFVEPPVHLSAQAMIEQVNKARAAGIIISPTEEGRRFAGYFDSQEKLDILRQMGHLSIGLPSEGAPSLIYIDKNESVEVQGSMPIIAAARGMSDPERQQSAWKIVHTPTGKSRVGAKGVNIEATDFSDLKYEPFPQDLPKEAFDPIDLKDITTEFHDSAYKVTIDTNEFGETFRKLAQTGNVAGQIAYDQDQIIFYSKMDKKVRELEDVSSGEEQTECLTVYLTDLSAKPKVEEILAQAIEEDGASFKAVGGRMDGVELTKYKGRVIHSSHPKFLANKEKIAKKAVRGKNTKERKKTQSYIYMEPTSVSKSLGFKAA